MVPGDLERPEQGKTSRPWGHARGLVGQTDAEKAWERISAGKNSLNIIPFVITYLFHHLRKAILLQTKRVSPEVDMHTVVQDLARSLSHTLS